ncbi:Uncharacterised protein [Pantoea agglomerans]|uniref:Uncharacterized protein n=1 Tax=Enterobacter agglomerans TaxID=549 RepID=A0A379LQV2_ENTAG|nr:Uncharacterised protein [Pantoea agglomerans]
MMMVIEGAPAWLFCIIWFYLVPKSIQAASWLNAEDRDYIQKDLAAEQSNYRNEKSDPLVDHSQNTGPLADADRLLPA